MAGVPAPARGADGGDVGEPPRLAPVPGGGRLRGHAGPGPPHRGPPLPEPRASAHRDEPRRRRDRGGQPGPPADPRLARRARGPRAGAQPDGGGPPRPRGGAARGSGRPRREERRARALHLHRVPRPEEPARHHPRLRRPRRHRPRRGQARPRAAGPRPHRGRLGQDAAPARGPPRAVEGGARREPPRGRGPRAARPGSGRARQGPARPGPRRGGDRAGPPGGPGGPAAPPRGLPEPRGERREVRGRGGRAPDRDRHPARRRASRSST